MKNLLITLLILFFITGQEVQAQHSFKKCKVPENVDKIYKKGLRFLVANQNNVGYWNMSRRSTGVAAFAVLSLLAYGQNPNHGTYSENIRRGLDFLLKTQNYGKGMIGVTMYHHGFATLAFAEAFGAVDDKRLGPALKKAVGIILQAQKNNKSGAWRYYQTSQDADSTITGAQLMALFAARNAGLKIPQASINSGLNFLKLCAGKDGGFGYTDKRSSNTPRTAIAVLMYALADKKNSPVYKQGLQYLKKQTKHDGYVFYSRYYLSQALFQSDPQYWQVWNKSNILALVKEQQGDGSWDGQHGKVFSTSAALLSLALNYRYLPIYER